MNAIKNSLKTVRASFESVPFLKFMVTAGVYIFAAGGLLWIIAGFLPTVSFGTYFVKTLLASFGRIAIAAGLLFALIKGDELILMISSAAVSLCALVIAIIEVAAARYAANFESWLFFLIFGGLAALIFLFGDNMKDFRAKAEQNARARAEQRAAAQAAAAQVAAQQQAAAQQTQLIECPNCKGPVPINAQFCPNCGAPNPAMQYQAQQAPPQAPPQTPPPAAPEVVEAAPASGAPAPETVQAAPAPEAAPEETPEASEAAPETAKPATKTCAACGSEIPEDSAFCGQCGAKQ